MSPPLRWSLKMMPHWSGIAHKAAITSFIGTDFQACCQIQNEGFTHRQALESLFHCQ